MTVKKFLEVEKLNDKVKFLVDKLENEKKLSADEFLFLLKNFSDFDASNYLAEKSRAATQKCFGNKIFVRGLIEFTNYCHNNCFYCGIRKDNRNAERYRLTSEQIFSCCEKGYELGFRTFVLQGGEDLYFSDEKLVSIISRIKEKFPDCALTLSIGEKSFESYKKYFDAGADRFLLRHETANDLHYKKLHPENLLLANRKKCLYDLKEIGYQVGTGFIVGSPFQTFSDIVEDLLFIKEFSPHMIGIGPFIPHKDTKFYSYPRGNLFLTLFLIAIIRLMLSNSLIPATTALGTINNEGREKGILYGANVLMPNLSPIYVRKKYLLYDNKICTGEETAECIKCLDARLKKIGYEITVSRGDLK